ncbi:MAG TPA: hypothetical protein PLN79_14935 [bacterium]|nr:hypothetical protein [bacterium]HND78580.1 hypothetical protein [bacterium]
MIVKSTLLLLWALIAACSASRTQVEAQQDAEKYKLIAIEKFSKDIKYVFNSTRTHVLCIKETRPEHPPKIHVMSFLLIEASTGHIILEETTTNAQAEWISESEVRVIFITGMPKENSHRAVGYIYNVISKVKTDL